MRPGAQVCTVCGRPAADHVDAMHQPQLPQAGSFALTVGSSSYVPPTGDPGPSGPTGAGPGAPQAPGEPWWRYENSGQPPGANYQAPPPVYPGPYQGPPGPTLPAPRPTRPPGSRKPLIYGLLAGLVAAGVAAGVLVLSHKPTTTTPPVSPTTVQPSSAPATTQSPTVSAQEQAAENLSALLTQSVTDRSSIVSAVADVTDCGPTLNQDPQTLQNAATSRQNLLNELANLSGAANLPPNLLTALKGAWQSSMEADQAYAKWAQDEVSNGCTKNDTSDPNYQAAIGPDGQATTYKQTFVGLWNPIATQYGLPTYVWNEL